MSTSPAQALPLSVPRASALYIGALFGPGLLLLPGLAAQQAGPASIIAWVALLGLSAIFATVFAALGKAVPGAAGAAGYAAAGLGRRAATMTRWWFLAGVIAGAPIVCLIGASYVTALTGGGPLARAAVAAGLLLAVLGLALGGVRASTMAQLLLVALLIVVVVTAVAGSASAARPANWTPFAPHGWLSVGRAAATLMLSFVGWEAVAPLTGRLRAGQLSRVIGIAFTVTAVLYLGLAVATVSCLGRGADLTVPLADLLQLAIGPAGRAVAAAAALVLTAGSVNAYISGASEMLRELTAVPGHKDPNGPGRPPRLSAHALLGVIALVGLVLIGLSALRLADIIALVSVPTAMFLCVYLSCTASAVRILAGPAARPPPSRCWRCSRSWPSAAGRPCSPSPSSPRSPPRPRGPVPRPVTRRRRPAWRGGRSPARSARTSRSAGDSALKTGDIPQRKWVAGRCRRIRRLRSVVPLANQVQGGHARERPCGVRSHP